MRILDHLTLPQDAAVSEAEASLQKTVSPTAKHRASETTVGAEGEVPRAAHRIAKHKAGDVLEIIFWKIFSKLSLKV